MVVAKRVVDIDTKTCLGLSVTFYYCNNNSNSNNQISIAPYASYRGAVTCGRVCKPHVFRLDDVTQQKRLVLIRYLLINVLN